MSSVDAHALVTWFEENARVLPWRVEPRDPYRVWVSEVMLQQTRVETVLRYYEPFLQKFPTVRALAEASDDAVAKAWEGLGYYRRARQMRQAARVMVERHGARVPERVEDLAALPGFGAYTAGAVASLAFGARVPAVDGNVLRVVSRLRASPLDISKPATGKQFGEWVVEDLMPAGVPPGRVNEALIEVGATVCRPKAPACDVCPLRAGCVAWAKGVQEAFPNRPARKDPVPVRVAVALIRRHGKLMMHRPTLGILAGTWMPPWVEVPEGHAPEDALRSLLVGQGHRAVRVAGEPVAQAQHRFTHRVWRMEAFEVDVHPVRDAGFVDPGKVAVATAFWKLLQKKANA